MNSEETGATRREAVVDRADMIGGAGRVVILASGLVGAAVAFAIVGRDQAEPFVLGLLGVLAMIGVFTLFAGAIGLLRISGRSDGNPLAKAFIDGFAEGVLVTDREGRIVYANRAYADLTGAESGRDLHSVESSFSGDSAADEILYRLSQSSKEGREATEELRLAVPAAGENAARARWYRISVQPIAFAKASHALWRVADITEARKEEELVFLELQHAIDYLDHSPAGFLSAEPDGRIVYLNATLAEWLSIDLARFTPGELSLTDLVRGDGAALLASAFTASAVPGSERTEIVDLDMVRRNGQSLPVRLLHKVPVGADGAPGATRTIVLNRGPGEDASEAVRAAEVRFARFFNNTPIAIASVDRRGRVGRTNAPFARMFGAARGEGGAARRLSDFLKSGDRRALEAAIEAAAAGKSEIAPLDVAIGEKGERSARFYISAVAEGGDEVETAVVYALDTTEQRALEAQFAQSQKMESIGQLAGGVAHDFNNVLTAIIGFSDLLLANHRPSDPSFQDIMNIKQNANRAAGLVRQLLAFSRRQTLRPQVLVLADLLSDLSILLQRLLGEKVKLVVVHGRDLWSVRADLNQFEQVIINLAVNARDAMPQGGTLTIRTHNISAPEAASARRKGLPAADYVLLEVTDTGTGIPLEVQERIFEPFFSTKEVGKGTGLGLSTVYGIVQQTGGHIFFDSQMGKGTTFLVYLPRHAAEPDALPEQIPEKPAELTDLTGTQTILLVEDEEAVRAFAQRALQQRGYVVHCASTGIEALQVMEETGGAIDLVVSDVVMPELDGPSLLRELRKQRPDLKIIFISGYAEEAFKKNLPEGESFVFLPKPFSLKQLATAVKETLGR